MDERRAYNYDHRSLNHSLPGVIVLPEVRHPVSMH
jgi:hypothetical protein